MKTRTAYETLRFPKWPPCCDVTWLSNLITISDKLNAPKPGTKTPKNQQVEEKEGTCTPDQGSGATRGILGYTMQNLACANRQKLQNNIWKIKTKTKRPKGHTLQTTIPKPYPRLVLVPSPLIPAGKIVII